MKRPECLLVFALVLAAAATTASAEFFTDEPIVSPDGSSEITLRFGERGMGTEWHITLARRGRVLYRRVLPDGLDVRYVKASWSPSSRAVLLGRNYKDGMDLTILRIVRRRVISTDLALADRMFKKEEKELSLRPELQSDAPVKRVTWSTVKWLSPTRCRMLYILHGLGYEGEGDVAVDFSGRRPVLRTSRLRPLAHPEYFNTD